MNFTGAIERVETENDVLLGAFTAVMPTKRPDVYMPDFLGTIEMQSKQPACGAHSGQSFVQILKNWFRGSPKFLWKEIKKIDGFAPEDGTSMPAIFKTLKNIGICSYSLLPNDTSVTLAEYTDPSAITPEMEKDASNNKTGVYGFTFNPNMEQIKQAIYDHKAVILLLRIGAEWWTTKDGVSSWQEKDILPLRSDHAIGSGHFVTAFAYDEKYIYFANEWSTAWGKNGIGYFTEDYVPRCVEIGTLVDIEAHKYIFTKTLKYGDKNSDVRMLQVKLGMPTKYQTGNFLEHTLQAVKDFQLKNGLKVDGIVGPKTNDCLNK